MRVTDLRTMRVKGPDPGGIGEALDFPGVRQVLRWYEDPVPIRRFFEGEALDIAHSDVPLFRDGAVPLTDAPGLGLELDADVCRRYLAPGETWFGD